MRPSVADVRKLFAMLRDGMETTLREGAPMNPTAVVVAGDGTPLAVLARNTSGPRERDLFVEMVRESAREADACSVIFLTDMYYKRVEVPPGVSAREHARRHRGSIAKDPDKAEALMAQLEHEEIAGTEVWFGRYERDRDGRPSAVCWERMSDGSAKSAHFFEGRFTGLLPRKAVGNA